MKTIFLNKGSIKEEWLLIDAVDIKLGRLAALISNFLKGKHKPEYTPHVDNGTRVVVVNSDHLKLSGAKYKSKEIYHHTGFPGGIKKTTPQLLFEKNKSPQLLANSVKGMLSINKGPLTRIWLNNLKIYSGEYHPHAAQKPQKIDVKSFNNKNHR